VSDQPPPHFFACHYVVHRTLIACKKGTMHRNSAIFHTKNGRQAHLPSPYFSDAKNTKLQKLFVESNLANTSLKHANVARSVRKRQRQLCPQST
jgi:hypothetical protein